MRFAISGAQSGTQYVNFLADDVVVTFVAPPPVPEPSSLALGLMGLAGLALWRRKARVASAAAR